MINYRNSPEISITRPLKHLTCYGFQRFTNGPYQGAHSFPCNPAALATRSQVESRESPPEMIF